MPREHRIATIDITGRRAGFTLLEGLIASVVLAILALGVVVAVTTSYQQSDSVRANSTATTLARQLVDEIVSKPYSPSDALGTGGERSTFTSVSAYNDYADNGNAIPLLEGGSLDVTGGQSYARSISVVVGVKPSIDTASPETDFAIVTVNVTCPDGQIVSIPELVANYALTRN
jgi:prepilin-type N-terminal cleavage/methylation domain-containing protein